MTIALLRVGCVCLFALVARDATARRANRKLRRIKDGKIINDLLESGRMK
jgi:hypothetical protein